MGGSRSHVQVAFRYPLEQAEANYKNYAQIACIRDEFRNRYLPNTNIDVVCFLLGNSPASEFYMPTFRNTLSVPSS